MTRKWLRQKEETMKGRKGETARALFIRRFWVLALQKDRESFFSFLKQLSVSFRI